MHKLFLVTRHKEGYHSIVGRILPASLRDVCSDYGTYHEDLKHFGLPIENGLGFYWNNYSYWGTEGKELVLYEA